MVSGDDVSQREKKKLERKRKKRRENVKKCEEGGRTLTREEAVMQAAKVAEVDSSLVHFAWQRDGERIFDLKQMQELTRKLYSHT
jgi:hypothetical protein